MHMLMCLAIIKAKVLLTIRSEQIREAENEVEGALFRDCLDLARSVMQVAEEEPVTVLTDLLRMLTTPCQSWS